MEFNRHSQESILPFSYSDKFISPDYSGYSFSRIPGFIRGCFGATGEGSSLPESVHQGFEKDYDAVVLVFLDAFGMEFMSSLVRDSSIPSLERLVSDARCSALTSMFPSTTAVHVTGIHTGLTAAETGLFEWHYYEDRVGEVVTPLPYRYACDLFDAKKNKRTLQGDDVHAELFVPRSNHYLALSELGVQSYIHQPALHLQSPYNEQIFGGTTNFVPITGFEEGLAGLAQHVKEVPGKSYHYYYHDGLDSAGHVYGPEGEEFHRAAETFFEGFEKCFLQNLSGCSKDVLLILTADHGQVLCPAEKLIYLDRQQPELEQMLRRTRSGLPLVPVGSVRDFFVYPEPQYRQQVFEMLSEVVQGSGLVCWTEDLRREGLFGPHESDAFCRNMGDIVVLGFEGSGFYWAGPQGEYVTRYNGHHGGLAAKEAVVPFILKEI